MTRLTNDIRDAIWRKLAARAFGPKVEDLMARRADHAIRVYENCFYKDLAAMEKLPEGWLPIDDDFKVQFGSEVCSLNFTGWGYGDCGPYREFTKKRPDPIYKRFTTRTKQAVLKVYEAREAFAEEHVKLTDEHLSLIQTIQEAKHSATVVMNQTSSLEKLIKLWPEVEEFARPFQEESERRALLPAIPVAQLNSVLGLPPEENAQ